MLLIDLVFQSGEFYGDTGGFWGDLFVELAGAGLGALVTIWLFLRALKNERQKEQKKEAEEKEKALRTKSDLEKEKVLYLHYLVDSSMIFSKDLVRILNQFYHEVQNNISTLPMYNRTPSNDLQRLIHNIDREQHFLAYRNQVKGEGILKFYGILDYVENVRVEIEQSLEKAKQIEYEKKIELRAKLDKFSSLCIKYKRAYLLQETATKEEFQKVEQAYHRSNSTLMRETSNCEALINNVFMPLIEYHHDKQYSDLSSRFIEIIDLISEIMKLYQVIVGSNNGFAMKIKEYADNLTTYNISLREEFKALDEYRKVTFPQPAQTSEMS